MATSATNNLKHSSTPAEWMSARASVMHGPARCVVGRLAPITTDGNVPALIAGCMR